ncbi:hypothetical protein [Pseudanabaena phage PA-SR01]|nr:hypothetical protein [Pseudanabaena phage PA-SR01]
MSLLSTTKRYVRPQPQQQESLPPSKAPLTLISILENEEYDLQEELYQIEEAKNREVTLRRRLDVVQQSLKAFRALEASPEPIQEQPAQLPVTQERRVRKAATKTSGKPNQRKIESEDIVSDTKNINLVHDDFSTFPE